MGIKQDIMELYFIETPPVYLSNRCRGNFFYILKIPFSICVWHVEYFLRMSSERLNNFTGALERFQVSWRMSTLMAANPRLGCEGTTRTHRSQRHHLGQGSQDNGDGCVRVIAFHFGFGFTVRDMKYTGFPQDVCIAFPYHSDQCVRLVPQARWSLGLYHQFMWTLQRRHSWKWPYFMYNAFVVWARRFLFCHSTTGQSMPLQTYGPTWKCKISASFGDRIKSSLIFQKNL